jgi:2-haloalkanoic acid dehalogenase type II
MPKIKCIAFDCFGTVFDMAVVSREEIAAYVEHVKRDDFSPYKFPDSWWQIKAHADAADGIRRLQDAGFSCVTLSNGSANLLRYVSRQNGILWDFIIDLAKYRVYKPHIDAYRTVEKQLGFKPSETLMVTANPTFGDIEGAAAIGMQSQVIRQPGFPQTIIELADILAGYSHA